MFGEAGIIRHGVLEVGCIGQCARRRASAMVWYMQLTREPVSQKSMEYSMCQNKTGLLSAQVIAGTYQQPLVV